MSIEIIKPTANTQIDGYFVDVYNVAGAAEGHCQVCEPSACRKFSAQLSQVQI